jgi:hypothetical protein
MINELELIEQKSLREQYIDRIDILDKVKKLLLLPDINLATTEQVANFYDVQVQAIKSLLFDHKDELMSDGYVIWLANDFKSFSQELLKITVNRGSFDVQFSNEQKERFSPRGVGLFTRRAILRVGMLLRDSLVAKEVRTQLLNIEEKAPLEQKIQSITEEQLLMIDIMSAKNDIDQMVAISKLNNFKNKQINVLEDKVEMLVNGILTWDTREAINRMVRKIAYWVFDNKHIKAWDKIYAEMLYKHNININSRKTYSVIKNPTIFDVLNDDEIKLLVKTCLSLCELYKIDISDLMMENQLEYNVK